MEKSTNFRCELLPQSSNSKVKKSLHSYIYICNYMYTYNIYKHPAVLIIYTTKHTFWCALNFKFQGTIGGSSRALLVFTTSAHLGNSKRPATADIHRLRSRPISACFLVYKQNLPLKLAFELKKGVTIRIFLPVNRCENHRTSVTNVKWILSSS